MIHPFTWNETSHSFTEYTSINAFLLSLFGTYSIAASTTCSWFWKPSLKRVTITWNLSWIRPTPSPSWGGTSPIPHPRGPPESPKVTKNTTVISRSHLAVVFIGKEGNNHLKSVTCLVPLICPTPSPSWGSTSPIPHPRGPPQSPKATKNTTKISRSHLAAVFIGKEGNNHLKSVTC